MIVIEIFLFFALFAVFGVAQEVFWTSIFNFSKNKDYTFMGVSSLWMFPIYGAVFFIILFGRTYFPSLNIILRGLIYTILILCWEYISGFILRKTFGRAPWDYSDKKIRIAGSIKPINFNGLICLDFALVWFIESLIAEALYLFLKSHLVF